MKVIDNFLFCTQKFTDSEETKPLCINLAAVSNIRVVRNTAIKRKETVAVDMDDDSVLLLNENPETFFNEFAELLQNYTNEGH